MKDTGFSLETCLRPGLVLVWGWVYLFAPGLGLVRGSFEAAAVLCRTAVKNAECFSLIKILCCFWKGAQSLGSKCKKKSNICLENQICNMCRKELSKRYKIWGTPSLLEYTLWWILFTSLYFRVCICTFYCNFLSSDLCTSLVQLLVWFSPDRVLV